jgi:hypothetical protein
MVFMAAAAMYADKKDDGKFLPGAASSYPAKQTNDAVTVAVAAYDTEELAHRAFGKLDPNQYGILPVLIIIQNDTDQALKLDHVIAEYTGSNGRHVEATPSDEVQTLGGPERVPEIRTTPVYIPHKQKKNPLSAWEIEGRAFAAKMIPPHESASGFFYFQTTHRPGSTIYLTGIKQASTGKDVMFFEINLDKK